MLEALTLTLAREPHVVTVGTFQYGRTVDVIRPGHSRGGQDDLRGSPCQAVLAFHKCHAPLRPPRNPHPVDVVLAQHGHIEAGAVLTAQHGIAREFDPATGRVG